MIDRIILYLVFLMRSDYKHQVSVPPVGGAIR
jgi:hypothetical protein